MVTPATIDIGIGEADRTALASDANDESSADLLTQRLQVHEKTASMLRSMLG